MPMKKKEAKGGSSAPDVAPEEPKMDIKSILKDIEFLGSSHMTWKEKKDLENRKVVSLGGKPPKKQRLPLSVARVTMKKQKEREEKLLQETTILGRFGAYISSGAKKVAERRRPEDRVLRATEGNFRNGVLNVKHLLQPSAPRGADDNGRHAISKGKKNKGGKKGHGMATVKYHSVCSPFHGHLFQEIFRTRKRNGVMKVSVRRAKLSVSNAKRANLSASKRERIKLPSYGDEIYHISEFFSHPSGVEAILNTRALQSYQSLDSNLYRCILPQVRLLNFEVAPILDLQVTPTSEDCIVEMLSCKFEGSDLVERQNEHFSASMRNHIRWETIDAQPFLDVDVKLNLVLEIYTQPFALLPTSAVEVPGNIMMQALVDQLVPLLGQQLLQDYEEWVHQQRKRLQ
ncbi:UNVERIFIED_CONTAM: hypothetical protein Scaly_0883000 [Sesamum calycinum]|uniref:DUF1997 family protein n=1 Tax=Sesamum calycinum TaxID=2727403 RepID=A0AAW2QWC4_9LAMI